MRIYSMNISAIDPNDEKWYKYLSTKRIEKVKRLRNDRKKAQSIGAELLLRRAVNYKNAEWDTDDRGKLYLTYYPETYVNLSHSGEWAVCAVHNAPVGIDIQYCRDFDERLIERCFSADEKEYILQSGDRKDAFYTLWTKKESLLKACGKGLTVPLESISVLSDKIEYDGVLYRFKEYSIKDKNYKLFVCFAPSE